MSLERIAELDESFLTAPKYRFMALSDPQAAGSRYWNLARYGRWSIYTEDRLRVMAGAYPFDLYLEGALASRDHISEAWVRGRWARARLPGGDGERALGGGGPPHFDRMAAEMRSRRLERKGKMAGLSEAAQHLIRHEGLAPEEAMAVARGAGYKLDDTTWASAQKNGRRRDGQGKPCRFCGERNPNDPKLTLLNPSEPSAL